MLRKIILFALAAVFLVSGALPAASPDPASEWRRAEMLLLDRKASEAYPVFFNLLQRYPGHSSLMLGLARSAALTGRYDEAGRLYRDLLMKFPDDPVLLNESDQVRGLRAGTASPTTVNFRMRAGVIYDSNANQGAPDDLILDLGGWRLVVDDTKRIGTFGGYFGANFNLSRRFSDSSPWSLVADSGLYIRGNEDSDLDDIKSSEWQWFRAGAGLRYAQGRNLFEFRVKGEVFDYEFTNHVYAWGPELTYLRAVTPTFHLISQLSVDWREYQRNPGRDGHYGQLAQYGRFFFGDNTHSLTVGLAYLWGRPEMNSLGHWGWSVPVRMTVRPGGAWEVSPHAGITAEYYKGPAVILDREARRDIRIRSGVDVTYKLTERWRIEFNYSYNRDNSNSAFYDYAQHVVGLGMSWGF